MTSAGGEATWQRVQRASSPLSSSAVRAMEQLPWFAALPAAERSYVGLVLHAGLDAFSLWLREPAQPPPVGPELFAAAPRELTRVVTLKQTVQLIRVIVGVVEELVRFTVLPRPHVAALTDRYSERKESERPTEPGTDRATLAVAEAKRPCCNAKSCC